MRKPLTHLKPVLNKVSPTGEYIFISETVTVKPFHLQTLTLFYNSTESVNSSLQNTDVSSQILAELQKLNGRIATVEEKVQNNAQKLSNVVPQVYNTPVTQPQLVGEATNVRSRHSSAAESSVRSQDVVVPSLNSLQMSQRIQAEVDERLRHLAHLSTEQGKLKSQRGAVKIFMLKNRFQGIYTTFILNICTH